MSLRAGRAVRRGAAIVALVAVAIVAAVVAALSSGSQISLGPTTTAGRLQLDVGWVVDDVRVRVDGRDVTTRLQRNGRRFELSGTRLRDGRHRIRVVADRRLGPIAGLDRRWTVEVDRTAPRAGILALRRTVRRDHVTLRGHTERGATVRAAVRGDERRAVTVGADGRYALNLDLREGANVVAVTVSDRAGNSVRARRTLTRDSAAPVLRLHLGRRRVRTDTPTIRGTVADAGDTTVRLLVGGRPATAEPVAVRDGRFRVRLGALHEGEHEIGVRVRDRAGNVRRAARTILVDSTDRLGTVTVGLGARGADARRLLGLLRRHGGLRGGGRETIGPVAVSAVRRFQRRKRLAVDGLVGPDVRTALLGGLPARIVIDLSEFALTLMRGETRVRSYPIAVGQPRYPTPTGTFRVVDKQVDPVWTPPDAPWAAELGTIPAGPGNPLGTRWIGTSRGAIGIHGTTASGSIGTAASHGCIRMHIPDVEQLFEQVRLGTPITIRA